MATKWKCYKKNFLDTWIRSLKSDNNLLISDKQIPGLHLRFYATTRNIVFYLGYNVKHTSIHRNMLIGKYGNCSLKEVRERARKVKQLVIDGRDPMQEQADERKKAEKEKAQRMKVKDLLELYFEKYCKVHKKPNTQKSDRGQIDRYLKPMLGELCISDLDLPILIDFYNRIKEKTSFSTANHAIMLVSGFWNWCELYKYLPINSNPCRRVPKGHNKKKEIKPLSLDEYKRLFAAMEEGITQSPYSPRMFSALKILMLTGCRTSEITKLKKSNLDLEGGFLYLDDSKNDSNKIPLGAPAVKEIRKALAESPEDSEYVFPATRGNPGAVLDLRKAHVWALNRAGLRHLRKHDFRHSFISVGTDIIGVPIQAVSSAIGHKKVSTTEIYSHMKDKTRLQTAEAITTAITR
ncbi:MAG: tyrosine-type recombinase/integrase [Bacteroidales bacterium]|jgi:integrase|nr:tyrosine-type recombinase/integrase [Bacteroidales bacterium]